MKTIGIINIIYGGLGLLGGVISLLVMLVQFFIFGAVQHGMRTTSGIEYDLLMYVQNIYKFNFLIVPIAIAISALFLTSGIRILKKVISGVKLTIGASIASIANYFITASLIWFLFLQKMLASITELDTHNWGYYYFAIVIVAGVLNVGYPVFLLIYLKRDRYLKYYEQTV